MSPILKHQWNKSNINQFEKESGQALVSDEPTLVSFSQDFGKLIQSYPAAVCAPKNVDQVQTLILYCLNNHLPLVIRGNGLSQSGQSLPIEGGLSLSMQNFSKPLAMEDSSIWVEANTTWASLLDVTLKQAKAPYVLPYNCNLSVAGVLSAGGVGASSFKYGFINAHVAALEVVDGTGSIQTVTKNSLLFAACLSGQGRCGVITKAKIELRPVLSKVKTFSLVYADAKQWFEDIEKVKSKVDYMELFCSPSVQGTKLKDGKRVGMAQWLYGMHVSIEFSGKSPQLSDIAHDLAYWNLLNVQEEDIAAYYLRHNSRFDMMKTLGQWDLFHPWYECFVPTRVLKDNLEQILDNVSLQYASFAHVVPIAREKAEFLMFPEADSVCEFMILNPGIPLSLKDSCLKDIEYLDDFLLKQGGKRYLSGYLGEELSKDYWAKHFGDKYSAWVGSKKVYDPGDIFNSILHQ